MKATTSPMSRLIKPRMGRASTPVLNMYTRTSLHLTVDGRKTEANRAVSSSPKKLRRS